MCAKRVPPGLEAGFLGHKNEATMRYDENAHRAHPVCPCEGARPGLTGTPSWKAVAGLESSQTRLNRLACARFMASANPSEV